MVFKILFYYYCYRYFTIDYFFKILFYYYYYRHFTIDHCDYPVNKFLNSITISIVYYYY